MARKQTDFVTLTERAMRKAIAEVPGLSNVDEAEYCEIVLGALDLIREGTQMRADELGRDER